MPPIPAPEPEEDDDLSPANQLYLEYRAALKIALEQRDSGIKCRKPQPQCWMGFKVGRSGFEIHTWASKEKKYICVGLTTDGNHGKTHFNLLKQDKIAIEREVDAELEWEENNKQNYIHLYLRNTDLENQQDWSRQHEWLCEQLETFRRVFVPRIQALNVSVTVPK